MNLSLRFGYSFLGSFDLPAKRFELPIVRLLELGTLPAHVSPEVHLLASQSFELGIALHEKVDLSHVVLEGLEFSFEVEKALVVVAEKLTHI